MSNRLTPDKVREAVAILSHRGEKATNRAIIEYFGYGSFSTLAKLKQTHPDIFLVSDKKWQPDLETPIEERLGSKIEAKLAEIEARLSPLLVNLAETVVQEKRPVQLVDEQATRLVGLADENKYLKTAIAGRDIRIQSIQEETLQLRKERDEALDITASQQERLTEKEAANKRLQARVQTLQDENTEIVERANSKRQQWDGQKQALEQERAYADSLRKEVKALKTERDRQRTIESEQLQKATDRIVELEAALSQTQTSISQEITTQDGNVIEGEVSDIEIESAEGKDKEELIKRFEEYMTAEWNEKQQREIELYNNIRVWLAYKWSNDVERLQNAILEINTTKKRHVAVALSESTARTVKKKPYVVHCLVLYRIKDGFDYTLIRKRKEYTLERAAHKKAAEWLNGFND